jgi:Flp pilus assembly protein TadG
MRSDKTMRHAIYKLPKCVRRGAAATELAICLPLLIAFTLTTIDFGRFAYLAIAMDSAVRVGAEYGATRTFTDHTRQSWEDEVKNRVNEELSDVQSGWLTDLEVTVTTSSTSDDLARVNVAADAHFSTIVDWSFLSNTVDIHREISVRQFR